MVFGEKRRYYEEVDGKRVFVTYRVFDTKGSVYLGVAAWVIFMLGLVLG